MKPDLHIIDLREKSIADLEACKKVLSSDEMTRMQRFATPELQRKFALNRGALRFTLGEHLKVNPALLEFTYNEFGKPTLKMDPRLRGNDNVQFNMAHSGDYCVIALLPSSGLIGVDIEYCDQRHHPLEIAKRFFTPREYEAIKAAQDPVTLFFHIWTQKEAFLKAIGQGLTFGLDQFEVAIDLNQAEVKGIQDSLYANKNWHCQTFATIPQYRLALTFCS